MKREPWVLAFAMVFPTVMAWLYFVVVSPAVGMDAAPNPMLQALYGAGKVAQFVLPLVWLALVDRSRLRFARTGSSGIGVSIAFGLAVAASILVLYYGVLAGSSALSDTPARIRSKLNDFGTNTPLSFWALALVLSLVHSALEEYYWRWFVFGRLRHWLPVGAAVVLSGIAFMGHHVLVLHVYFPGRFWSIVAPFSLGIAFGGMAWAAIYQATGSLVGPWLSHVLVDLAIMTVGYQLVFGL